MTDEYMNNMWAEIERRMDEYDASPTPTRKTMLECMVADYEAKMKLKLQDETQIQSTLPPWEG